MFYQAFPVSALKTHLVMLFSLLFTACNGYGVLHTLTKEFVPGLSSLSAQDTSSDALLSVIYCLLWLWSITYTD